MLFALSTKNSIVLAAVGATFIIFSLISSFVLPRGDPNFPGRRRNAYLVLCVALFFAMMATVLVFGKEEEEAEAGAHETQPTETQPAPSGPYANGDAAAGKAVFASSACGACHVLKAAGATGAVGPNLDEKKPDEALTIDRVVNGKGAMPPFKAQLTDKQIADVVAFVHEST